MTAAELCGYHEIQLLPESQTLLSPELTPRQYFDLLMTREHHADARRVLAHALARRRALWWGCLCATEAYAHLPPPLWGSAGVEGDRHALEAITRFVVAGGESERRTIAALSEHCPADTPAGCLLMAAFFSGGSTSLPNLPFVPPRPFITGRLVGVAVYLASVWHEPEHYLDHLRHYLEVGLELAQQPDPWDPSPPVSDAESREALSVTALALPWGGSA